MGKRVGGWTAGLVMGATALTGCGNPTADTSACGAVDDAVVAAIGRRLEADGELRNARLVADAEDGVVFVSAELHLAEDEPDDEGDVLTWVTGDLSGGSFEAVDEHARDASSWPGAEYDVRREAAIQSRGCADLLRGDDGVDECADVEGDLAQLCELENR